MRLQNIPTLPLQDADRIEKEMREANQFIAWIYRTDRAWKWTTDSVDARAWPLYIGSIGGDYEDS